MVDYKKIFNKVKELPKNLKGVIPAIKSIPGRVKNIDYKAIPGKIKALPNTAKSLWKKLMAMPQKNGLQ